MSKEEKRVPEVRFEGFHDDWKQRKLGELSDIVGGGTPSTNIKEYWDGDINWYSPVEIGNDVYTYQSRKKITQLGLQKSSAKILPAGRTILFTSRAGIGDMAILENTGTTNQGFQSIIVKEDNDVYFIYSYGAKIKKKAIKFASGSTFLEISGKELGKLQLKVPSLIEQQKIGVLLKKIDNTIALHQRKVDKLQLLKKAALQSFLPKKDETMPKVRFTNFNELWNQRKLGEMGDTFAGLSGKTKKDFGHGNAKFITYVNVFKNPISDPKGTESIEIDNKQTEVRYGDIFFTTSSETPEEVGMSSIWLENTENVYLNSFCFGYRLNIKNDPYYLAFLLRSSVIRKKLMLLAQGISRYNISKKKVMEITIPIPTLEEQKHVGLFLKKIEDTISFAQTKLEELQKLKKAFLQKMFI